MNRRQHGHQPERHRALALSAALFVAEALFIATASSGLDAAKVGFAPLTKDELRECMDREDSIAAHRAGVDRRREQLARELATLSRDAGEVEAYNKRVAELNAQVASLNSEAVEVMTTCSSRSYRHKDKEEILKERGR